jgi:UDP-glucose 4-epimerase
MRLAITGGNGFLGKYIVKKFREEGHIVVACDISINDKLKHIQNGERHLDVTDTSDVDWLFYELKPDLVIHLAALAGAIGKGGGAESVHDPFNFFRVNVLGTLNVFESCRTHDVKKVIHMSSFSPYGITHWSINETNPLNPNNPYGSSKLCAEEIAKCYASRYGIKTVIFRAPLICGEGQRELNALREFVVSVKKGEPIVLLGEGTHLREFVHPSDVANAFVSAALYLDHMDKPYDIFVLGNTPVSMKDLANLVVKSSEKKVPIVHNESTAQVFDQYTDTSKVRRVLGWQPKISVEEIVKRVLADIK